MKKITNHDIVREGVKMKKKLSYVLKRFIDYCEYSDEYTNEKEINFENFVLWVRDEESKMKDKK